MDIAMSFNLADVLQRHDGQFVDLHHEHVNPSFAVVLRTIGFDIDYVCGQGAYLFDKAGNRYIDCLGGYAVFNTGRNHPTVAKALRDAIAMDLPNLPGVGPYRTSGILARELVALAPGELDTVYFSNSGTEAIEVSMKFARAATGRDRVVFCHKAYHGLTIGSLSINGNAEFRDGFGSLLPCTEIAFNDLAALEQALAGRDVAAFVVEPIQGKGVNMPDDDYLAGAAELCRKHGTLLVLDEVQTGFGRTGKMFACEHWNVEPDIMVVAKGLSGGYIPVSAVISKRWIHQKVFSSMDRCSVQQVTFGMNELAQVAGHHMDTIKLIPPLTLNEVDADAIVAAFDATIGACHRMTGPIWEVGSKLSKAALKRYV
jgi:acetylornithine/succinyldiaminopimelate/putrescine aminotransferase